MSRQKYFLEDINNIFKSYINNLDNGEDNIKLLEIIKNYSNNSKEAKQIYQQALVSQLLFYKRITLSKLPDMKNRFQDTFRGKIQSSIKENIWDYFNELIDLKGFTWSSLLKSIGINPQLSGQVRSGKISLQRFHPVKLAEISCLLCANSNKVVQLAYRELFSGDNTCKNDYKLHYRKYRDNYSVDNFHDHSSKDLDAQKEEMLNYMLELQNAISSMDS